MRLAPTLIVAFLLGGTAAAFAVTQRLKQERSPIFGTRFAEVAGPRAPAELSFRLREPETVTATVVTAGGDPVRTLLDEERLPAGLVTRRWDGRTDAGSVAPEGSYRLRVRLAEERRTIQLPNRIRLDTTAPELSGVTVRPLVFSPDGDGRADRVRVRYRVDEHARALLDVDGERVARGRLREVEQAAVDWYGKIGGRRAPPGIYRLTVRAEDRAGNVSLPSEAVEVTLRYLQVRGGPLRARAGRLFRVSLDTDARTVRWRIAGRSGVGPADGLRLRAPQRPGRFTLFVTANGRADRAVVVVRRAAGS